jgi:hypothetical protein
MPATNLIELSARTAKSVRAPRTRSVFLTPEETLAVLREAKDRGVRDWAMILLATVTARELQKSAGFVWLT